MKYNQHIYKDNKLLIYTNGSTYLPGIPLFKKKKSFVSQFLKPFPLQNDKKKSKQLDFTIELQYLCRYQEDWKGNLINISKEMDWQYPQAELHNLLTFNIKRQFERKIRSQLRENSFGINYYFEETYDDSILPYVRLAQVRGKKYLTESTYNYAEKFPEKKNRKFWFLLDSDTLSNPFWTGKKSKNWNEDALTQVSKFKKRYSLKK